MKDILNGVMRSKKLIIVIILVVVAFIFFSGSHYDDTLNKGVYKENDSSNAPYVTDTVLSEALSVNVSEDTEIKDIQTTASVDGGYKLNINLDEITDEIIETLEDNRAGLDNYLSPANKKEYMKKMIKAELATQYPDLRNADKIGTPVTDGSEFQGVIKFVRHKSDGSTSILQYIPLGASSSTDTGTLNGLINHLNNGGSLPTTINTANTTNNTPSGENTQIDLSKIFYIGDSWMVGMRDYGITDSESNYFQAEVGASAESPVFNTLNVKDDASAIVLMLGLNGANSQGKMKELIDTLSTSYPNKTIYVLKVFHVGKNYSSGTLTAEGFNDRIDTYNNDIMQHCLNLSNVKFVDATQGLIDNQGYLSDSYKSGEYHLTANGYKKLYENIKTLMQGQCVQSPQPPQTAREGILDYFSLDNEGNLVIAKYGQTITKKAEGSYEVPYTPNGEQVDYVVKDKEFLNKATEESTSGYSTYKINYTNILQQYTMPFEYLWTFLVIGRDEEFVSDLADLVLNSKIEISVYDSQNITEGLSINSYNSNQWQKNQTVQITKAINSGTGAESIVNTVTGEWSNPATITTAHHYQVIYTKRINENTSVYTTNADTWDKKYMLSYTYESTEPTNPGLANMQIYKNTEGDEEFEEGNAPSENIEYVQGIEELESQTENNRLYKRIDYLRQIKNNQNVIASASNSITSQYKANGTPDVKEKTDNDLKEGDEGYPNFCTLYLKSQKARGNITGAEEWLFETLQSNEATANMVDLTKYLLYCATEMDFGVKEYNMNIIDIIPQNKVKGTALSNYIKAWENYGLWLYETGQSSVFPSKYLSSDEANYIAYEDGSAGHNNIAYGIATYISNKDNVRTQHPIYGPGYYNWQEEFAQYGIDITTFHEGCYVDRQATQAVHNDAIERIRGRAESYLEKYLPEYEFSREQRDALTAVCYQYGNINGFDEAYRKSLNEDGTLDAEAIQRNYTRFNPTTQRKIANWRLFTEGIYTDPTGNEISVRGNLEDWDGDTYCNNDYTFPVYNQYDPRWDGYPYGGPNGLPSVPGNSGQQKTIHICGCGCCALAMVLSGYTGEVIDPQVLTQKMDEVFPDGSYYSPGNGSRSFIFYNKKLLEEYGCHGVEISSKQEALKALQDGYAVMGGEQGHYLAFVPVSSEDAAQGYVFRILDSAKGHNYLCKDFSQADAIVDGDSNVRAIIYPTTN